MTGEAHRPPAMAAGVACDERGTGSGEIFTRQSALPYQQTAYRDSQRVVFVGQAK
ncbi:hypothetical protein [Nitrosovibrio tenuis]|uniref:hypothetical protein n=1 Tax=Nitrosovibrio tenuis TaxID=1233 RepID=UPI0015A6B87E|nr:hypothetical protein [Nitrosovibrio tenuis]